MATFKLIIDESEENDYSLIAIHSVLEGYRLAFFLNKELPIVLSKSLDKIVLKSKKGESIFHKYSYEDQFSGMKWTLIQNLNEISKTIQNVGEGLFLGEEVETEIKIYLMPEFKNVDFFLKIDHIDTDFDSNTFLNKIGTIHNVSKVYEIEIDHIKSKNNLIF